MSGDNGRAAAVVGGTDVSLVQGSGRQATVGEARFCIGFYPQLLLVVVFLIISPRSSLASCT